MLIVVPETPVLATSPYQTMIDELNNSLHAEDSVEGMQNRLAAIASVLSNWGVSTVSHLLHSRLRRHRHDGDL